MRMKCDMPIDEFVEGMIKKGSDKESMDLYLSNLDKLADDPETKDEILPLRAILKAEPDLSGAIDEA